MEYNLSKRPHYPILKRRVKTYAKLYRITRYRAKDKKPWVNHKLDQEFIIALFDNESKARAYGGWGHHQALDRNLLFKVGNYAGQTATNLMNLNTLMMQHEIME